MFQKIKDTIAAFQFLRSLNTKEIQDDSTVDVINKLQVETLEEMSRLEASKTTKSISAGAFTAKLKQIIVRLEGFVGSINKRIVSLENVKVKLEQYRNVYFFGTKITSIQKEIDRAIEKLNKLRTDILTTIEGVRNLV